MGALVLRAAMRVALKSGEVSLLKEVDSLF